MLLISLFADIETNPGPIDYPCGNCALIVQDTDPAIECDDCGQWFHIQCESIGQSTFDDWVNTDRSFSWVCSKCESLNLTHFDFLLNPFCVNVLCYCHNVCCMFLLVIYTMK